MSKLSDPITICGKTAKNRIIFPPCVPLSFREEGDDFFGSQHIAHYTKVAEGGAGIIIVQGTNVLGVDRGDVRWTPGSRLALGKIVEVIHASNALALMQLSFGGDSETDLNALTTEELEDKQQDILKAALVLGELGFDGLEFHLAHGFLLCKLFDADANRRTDHFNGGIEGRTSIITDIIPEIRSRNGDDFILGLRMGAYLPDLETGLETARFLEKSGIDLLHITYSMLPPPPAPVGFPLSDMVYGGWLVKQAVGIPVIGVGNITTKEEAETLLENGYADLAGVARGILADPAMPGKILAGEPFNECAGCKECFWFTDHTKCPARLK